MRRVWVGRLIGRNGNIFKGFFRHRMRNPSIYDQRKARSGGFYVFIRVLRLPCSYNHGIQCGDGIQPDDGLVFIEDEKERSRFVVQADGS